VTAKRANLATVMLGGRGRGGARVKDSISIPAISSNSVVLGNGRGWEKFGPSEISTNNIWLGVCE